MRGSSDLFPEANLKGVLRNDTITTEKTPAEFSNQGEDEMKMSTDENTLAIPEEELYLVHFEPNDQFFPKNWSNIKKFRVLISAFSFTLCNALSSSMFATSSESIALHFHVSYEVAVLPTTLYILGFVFGPIFWGPLSEANGRMKILLPVTFGYACLSYIVSTAKDFQTLTVCRFFCGFLGGASMIIPAAMIGDLIPPKHRGRVVAPFSMTVCAGPCLGPIIAGFVLKNKNLDWRLNAYLPSFMSTCTFIAVMLFHDETYEPFALQRKAEIVREKTGNWAIHAPIRKSLDLKIVFTKFIARPGAMSRDLSLLLVALYGAFAYGILYLLLSVIPHIFISNYHFAQGVDELPYIAVFIGCVLGGVFCILSDIRYQKILKSLNTNKPVAKERLPAMMVGSLFLTAGLFWMCWTGDFQKRIPWIVPTLACSFVGFGFITIFQSCINYVVDRYTIYAASGLTVVTVLRSLFAATFPLFSQKMFDKLGTRYAGTLLGGLSGILVPVPFLFYKFDDFLRSRSKYSKKHDASENFQLYKFHSTC